MDDERWNRQLIERLKPSSSGVPVQVTNQWQSTADSGSEPLALLQIRLSHARSAFQLGRLDEAVDDLRPLRRDLSTHPLAADEPITPERVSLPAAANSLLGRIVQQQGRNREAHQLFADAVSLFEHIPAEKRFLEDFAASDYGIALYELHRTAQAIDVLQQAVALSSTDIDARRYLGLALLRRDQYVKARPFLIQAWQGNPTDLTVVEALARCFIRGRHPERAADLFADTGIQLGKANRVPEAMALFDRALAINADHATARVGRAAGFLAQTDLRRALAEADRILRVNPNHAWAREIRADVLRRLGQPEAALREIDAVLHADPNDSWARQIRAEALGDLERYEEALTEVDLLLTLSPDDLAGHRIKTEILLQLRRYEDALVEVDRVVALEPEGPWGHKIKGEIFRQLGRYEDALAELDRALAAAPDDAWALGTRGQVLRALKRGDEAVAALERALSLEPRLTWAQVALGDTLYDLRLADRAAQAYEHALEQDHDNLYALRGMALAQLALGRSTAALHYIEQARKHHPQDASILLDMAIALESIDDYDQALAHVEHVLTVEPTNYEALTLKGAMLIGIAQCEEAITVLARATAADPAAAAAFGYQGFAFLYAPGNRAREAETAFTHASERDREAVRWITGLADARRRAHGLAAARPIYRRALDMLREQGFADIDSLHTTGWCELWMEHYDDAIDACLRALTLDQTRLSVQLNLALALTGCGLYSLAAREYQKGEQILQTKQPQRQRGYLNEALHDLRDALAQLPNLADAEVTPTIERFEKALRELSPATSSGSTTPMTSATS